MAEVYTFNGLTDTIPEELLNDKGYFISIVDKKGECTVVVWDKKKKELERLPLTKWNENKEKYENLYGEILAAPPPPPQPPMPPAPTGDMPAPPAKGKGPKSGIPLTPPGVYDVAPTPAMPEDYIAPPTPVAPIKMPKGVSGISVNNHSATVTLDNGTIEKYNLDKADEKKKFHDKYGEMPTPPEPSAAPRGVRAAPVKVTTSVSTHMDVKVTPAIETISIKPEVATSVKLSTPATSVNLKLTPVESIKVTPVVITEVKTKSNVEVNKVATPVPLEEQ